MLCILPYYLNVRLSPSPESDSLCGIIPPMPIPIISLILTFLRKPSGTHLGYPYLLLLLSLLPFSVLRLSPISHCLLEKQVLEMTIRDCDFPERILTSNACSIILAVRHHCYSCWNPLYTSARLCQWYSFETTVKEPYQSLIVWRGPSECQIEAFIGKDALDICSTTYIPHEDGPLTLLLVVSGPSLLMSESYQTSLLPWFHALNTQYSVLGPEMTIASDQDN